MRKLILIFGLTLFCNMNFAQEAGTFTDTRDGKVYKTVKIGTQWIMAENLAYKPTIGNYWVYDNDQSKLTKYGYLYDWEIAQKIAPQGWHLPTKEEWETLCKFLGRDPAKVYNALKYGGSSGFNALLGGFRHTDGPYNNLDLYGFFWSATSDGSTKAWRLSCIGDLGFAILNSHFQGCGFSVRLFHGGSIGL